MKDNLTKLDHILHAINHPILVKFMNIEPESEVKDLLKQSKLFQHTDLIILYQWKNGINGASIYNGEFIELFSGGSFIDIRSANSLLCLDKMTEKIYDKKLPFIQSSTGDVISIDLDAKSITNGQLFILAPNITLSSEHVSIYDSLESWIATIIECYQQKAYFFEEGKFIVDYQLEHIIAKQQNPNSSFWE